MVRPRRGCERILWFFLLFGLLKRGGAWFFSCTVTQHDDQTTYNIVRHPPDAVKAFDCEYTWSNASEHVMAHNYAKAPELVLTNSINTLVTSRCIDKVVYARICVSEGERYTANCTIGCHGSSWRGKGYTPNLTAFIIILLVVVVLVVVGLLVFLCYRCKIGVPSSDQSRPGYCLVKRDSDSEAADVETE